VKKTWPPKCCRVLPRIAEVSTFFQPNSKQIKYSGLVKKLQPFLAACLLHNFGFDAYELELEKSVYVLFENYLVKYQVISTFFKCLK
jgi:hypothetical protein